MIGSFLSAFILCYAILFLLKIFFKLTLTMAKILLYSCVGAIIFIIAGIILPILLCLVIIIALLALFAGVFSKR